MANNYGFGLPGQADFMSPQQVHINSSASGMQMPVYNKPVPWQQLQQFAVPYKPDYLPPTTYYPQYYLYCPRQFVQPYYRPVYNYNTAAATAIMNPPTVRTPQDIEIYLKREQAKQLQMQLQEIPRQRPLSQLQLPRLPPSSTTAAAAPMAKPYTATSTVPIAKPYTAASALLMAKPNINTAAAPMVKPYTAISAVSMTKPSSITNTAPMAKPYSAASAISMTTSYTAAAMAKPSSISAAAPMAKPYTAATAIPMVRLHTTSCAVPMVKPSTITTSVPMAKPYTTASSMTKSSNASAAFRMAKPSAVTATLSMAKPSSVAKALPMAKPSSVPSSNGTIVRLKPIAPPSVRQRRIINVKLVAMAPMFGPSTDRLPEVDVLPPIEDTIKQQVAKIQKSQTHYMQLFGRVNNVLHTLNRRYEGKEDEPQPGDADFENTKDDKSTETKLRELNDGGKFPKRVKLEDGTFEYILGPNNTRITEKEYHNVCWSSAPVATRCLLIMIFSSDELATHTLTGKPSPAFYGRERPPKMQLDPTKVDDIVVSVRNVTGGKERHIRATITTKCADTSKKYKRRASKKAQKENEIVCID